MCSIIISAGILATTYQAQDLKDIHGDRVIGRHTLPIVLPKIARPSVFVGLAAWSVGLVLLWKLDLATAFIFMSVGLFTGVRFVARQTVPDDQVSFYWYNVRALHHSPSRPTADHFYSRLQWLSGFEEDNFRFEAHQEVYIIVLLRFSS